ncbi:MAG: cell division protein SepF [Tissierellia bacterium]|nr:cell division protein SepF [Tissierellia bacterium]
MSGFFDKLKGVIGLEEEYYDDDYEYESDRISEKQDIPAIKSKSDYEKNDSYNYEKPTTKRSNIVSLQSNSIDRTKINIHEPITYDDGPNIVDDIVARKVVVLNLEMLEADKKRQIFDFVSGGIYALNGKVQKVTKDIFVIAPKDVEIDGKLKEQIQAKGFYQL